MRLKTLFLSLAFILMGLNTSRIFACEVCGACFGSYLGIMPQYGKHFLSIRYQHQSYLSVPNPVYPSEENFYTTELWGRFNIHPKVQLLFFLPYAYNTRFQYGRTAKMRGLGDISLQANYILLNSGDSLFTALKHTLTCGVGIKLPSGKYQNPESGRLINPNFQLGTGSTDYTINLNYTIRYKKLGLNTVLQQKFNGTNPKNNHRFGHQFTATSQLFWWQNIKPFRFLPTVGINYESLQPNTFQAHKQTHTGGHVLSTNIGLQVYFRNLATGFTFQKPISQNLAKGEITAQDRLSIHFTYLF